MYLGNNNLSVHVTIVAVENNKHYLFWVCVCVSSLSYPACKSAYALWPVWL